MTLGEAEEQENQGNRERHSNTKMANKLVITVGIFLPVFGLSKCPKRLLANTKSPKGRVGVSDRRAQDLAMRRAAVSGLHASHDLSGQSGKVPCQSVTNQPVQACHIRHVNRVQVSECTANVDNGLTI